VVGATPAEDILIIRNRAGLGASLLSLNNILLERRRELAHEGQRIHDVKRLRQTVDGFAYDANKLVLPIPIREINAVGPSILIQNPGY
jgi:starch-binding outer membrane protein, SusD/RagB family